MIRATPSIDSLRVTFNITVTGLPVYLDNWAVINLAKGDSSRRKRFVHAVRTGGDLLFSVANAAELVGPQGKSFDAVKNFLDELGPHWCPVELNPFEVSDRERNGMGWESCLSPGLMEAYIENRMAGYALSSDKFIDMSQNFFRLGAVLDWVAKSDSLRKSQPNLMTY